MTRKQYLNLKTGDQLRWKRGYQNAGLPVTVVEVVGGQFDDVKVTACGQEYVMAKEAFIIDRQK